VTEPWPWPDSLDALIAAPEHHKLVLDNERVRVLDTHIPAGDIVPVHTHRWPAVYYTIQGGHFVRRDEKGNVLLDTRANAMPAGEPARFIECLTPHSVENVGEHEIHLISVEMKY
jgi:quercetin dioxygenase-like cupin family protein